MNTQKIAIDPGYEVAKRVRAASSWFVRSGDNVVGPVSIELLERGLAAGKIPADAEMAAEGRDEWRRIADVFPRTQPVDVVEAVDAFEASAVHEIEASAVHAIIPVPPPPPSVRYAEDPITIPKQGMLVSLFGSLVG